jgi:hypothetical protein
MEHDLLFDSLLFNVEFLVPLIANLIHLLDRLR